MNPIAPMHEPAIRDIPLCRLALAPENARKTPPDDAAQVQLQASIAEHDLLENLVVRPDEPDADGAERFAVVAGGRRLSALKALAENGTLHADHPRRERVDRCAGGGGRGHRHTSRPRSRPRSRAGHASARRTSPSPGGIATIGRDGTLQIIQGLVKPEDMPKDTAAAANGPRCGRG